jgi:hypothetical protein
MTKLRMGPDEHKNPPLIAGQIWEYQTVKYLIVAYGNGSAAFKSICLTPRPFIGTEYTTIREHGRCVSQNCTIEY